MNDIEKALGMITGKVLTILIALAVFRICGYKLTRSNREA